jgi:glycolate oxidase
MATTNKIDTALLKQLRDIVGDDGVVSRREELLTFESDGYSINTHMPDAVVFPRTTEEVQAIMRLVYPLDIPIIPRGAGTGLSGGSVPMQGGLIVAVTRLNKILDIDYTNRVALVETGVVNLHLTDETTERGYYFAPDPSSQSAATIGGNVAENAGGPHCLKYGTTIDHILGLELVLPTGEVMNLGGKTEDTGIGYDLRSLVIASEGMMGIITKIWCRLTHLPEATRTMLVIFDKMEDAVQACTDIISAGIIPAALEMIDNVVIQAIIRAWDYDIPGDAEAILILELDGLAAGMDIQTNMIQDVLGKYNTRDIRLAKDEAERTQLWTIRKKSVGSLGRITPNYYTQDATVPRTALPFMLKRIYEIGDKHDLRIGNVFHAGDGNLHPVVTYDARVDGMVDRVLAACHDIMEAAIDVGGILSGEHGIGSEKNEDLPMVFSDDSIHLMMDIRRVFDPKEQCNPGKGFPSGIGGESAGMRR